MKSSILLLFSLSAICLAVSDNSFDGSLTVGASIDSTQPVLTLGVDAQTQGGGSTVAFHLSNDACTLTIDGTLTAKKLVARAGGTVTTGAAPIRCWSQVSTVGNVTTGEDTLYTTSIGANAYEATHEALEYYAVYRVAGNANDKTFRVKFAGTTVFEWQENAGQDDYFTVHGMIPRKDSGSVKAWATIIGSDANKTRFTTLNVTFSNAQTFSVTGEATDTNDIQLEHFHMRFCP